MANAFTVTLIQALSEVPLHLYATDAVANTVDWRDLWRPAGPVANSFVAIDLQRLRNNRTAIVNFRLSCTFGANFVGHNVVIHGMLRGGPAMTSAPVAVANTNAVVVDTFVMTDRQRYPVAYTGAFRWSVEDGTTIITFATETPLEIYTIIPLANHAIQWTAAGVSVNLLRRYLVPWHMGLQGIKEFYGYAAEKIFQSPFVYDNVIGATRYFSNGLLVTFELGNYFRDLELCEDDQSSVRRVNCVDMAGVVQIVLSLCFPNLNKAFRIMMRPFGYIHTTK
jgi:hypothetical protein